MQGNNTLSEQLRKFIQAYYNNQIRNGILILIIVLSCSFALFTLTEYFSYFPSWVRGVYLYTFVLLLLLIFIWRILLPLLRKHGWIKSMSNSEAAIMIGRYFPEIDDKLLNSVQLQEQTAYCSEEKMELLLASIEQRTQEMRRFHFPRAINVRITRKYARYALLILLVLGTAMLFNNTIFTAPTHRIIHYNRQFEKPAPYQLVIQNKKLQTFENEDFVLNVKVQGDEVPEEVFINIDGVEYSMQQNKEHEFWYEFRNMQHTARFYMFTHEVKTTDYTLEVLEKPLMLNFSIELNYPLYIGKPNEIVDNGGDISVPEGTKITWKMHSRNTDMIYFRHNNRVDTLYPNKDQSQITIKASAPIDYTISNVNANVYNKDTLNYHVGVIPDQYPVIGVTMINDTAFIDRFYFKGTVEDDYGFTKLQFVYTVQQQGNNIRTEKVNIPLQERTNLQDFYYYFDAKTLQLAAGQTVNFYFEIFDNDAVNGAKSTRSSVMDFHLPDMDEINSQTAAGNEQTQKDIEKIMREGEKILKEIEALEKKMVEKKHPSWQEKKQMEDLIKRLQDIKNEGMKVVEERKRQQHINEQYQSLSEELMQKQQELQRRFDELFNDEMKSTLEELQQLMNRNMDKEKMNQLMDNIKINTEELNKQLDQNLELFKQLEIDSKLENAISKAEALAKEESNLAEKTKNKTKTMDEIAEEQKAINQQFDRLKQDFTSIQKLNEQLEDPYQLQAINQAMQEAEQALQQAQDETDKGNYDKASQMQQKAAEKMESLAQAMQEMMEEDENADMGEDINTIRQILDNIVKTSFAQEQIMRQMDKLTPQDPAMRELIQEQYRLKNQLQLISDSVSAVAKRQIMVEPFITKQVGIINQAQSDVLNMLSLTQEPSMRYYYSNNMRFIVSKEQYVMTSLNDLGLMLAESMKKMEEKQSQSSGKGKGNCSSENCEGGKKNKSGKSAKSMRQLQEKLNQQLQEMRKQLQQGQQQGDNPSQQGKSSMSEQFARMAAQQEAIRRMMQQYQSELKKNGAGYDREINRLLQDMEQTERELVNKTLTEQTLNRQHRILTRLLESERAEMQREKEEQRQSRQAVNPPMSTPPAYIEQQLNKKKETELYRTIPPTLNSYYREKVNIYFYQLNAQ